MGTTILTATAGPNRSTKLMNTGWDEELRASSCKRAELRNKELQNRRNN